MKLNPIIQGHAETIIAKVRECLDRFPDTPVIVVSLDRDLFEGRVREHLQLDLGGAPGAQCDRMIITINRRDQIS